MNGTAKIGGSLLAIVFGIAAIKGAFDDSMKDDAKPNAPPRAAAQPATKPELVSLPEMLATYEKNEVAGDQAYKGKRLRAIAVVKNIGVTLGEPTIELGEHGGLTCFFPESTNAQIAKLERGAFVAVDGEGNGGGVMGGTVWKDCTMVPEEQLRRENPEIFQRAEGLKRKAKAR